jgi:type IV secretory pathway VirB10-like protein
MTKTNDHQVVSPTVQHPGTVEHKAPRPAGLLPKKTQQLVILGVAVVMILIMWVTGGTKRAHSASAPPPGSQVQAPNPSTVEDFKETIQQQQAATRQPISQSNLQHLEALGLAGDVPPGTAVAPPNDAGVPQPGSVVGGNVRQLPPPDPISEDKKKREYLSLFAPNVAFTASKGQPDAASALLPPEPQILPNAPNALVPTAASSPVTKRSSNSEGSVNPSTGPPAVFNSFTGKRYVVFEGTVLETLLINRLNGTFAGPVDCLVTTDLYSHDRQHVLIPAGTKVLGEAKKVDAFGQQRLAVFFHRLVMPDGYSMSLDEFKGLSQSGETALRDKVNNHYLQIFGVSMAVGILGGIAEAGTGNVLTNSTFDQVRQGFGASMANSSINILDKFLNILPTVTIREGSRVKVYLSGDLLLPDYSQHTMQRDLGVEDSK